MPSSRKNRLRISGGACRGQFVQFVDNAQLRPSTERSREAIFSILDNLGAITAATVLDLYAGSGILGIEALSRGAAKAHFVEADSASARSITENLNSLEFAERGRVWPERVESFSKKAQFDAPVSLIFADPPYDSTFGREELAPLFKKQLLADSLYLLIERRNPAKQKKAGTSAYLFNQSSREVGQSSFVDYLLVSHQLRNYGDSEFEIVELEKRS